MPKRYSQRRRTYWEDARCARFDGESDCVFLTRMKERLRGALFREPDDSLFVLVPCNAVHTFGMKHDLDIAFLDGEGTVLAVHRKAGKRRRLRCPGARMTLERFSRESPWFTVDDRVGLKPTFHQQRRRKDDL